MQIQLRDILKNVQKPGRYTGGEPGSVYKNKDEVDLRFAFCFPDTYEVGMSFLGMKILYDLLNKMEGVWCERAFMPWTDMAQALKAEKFPLYALESRDALSEFDIVGFTLQYELTYTNILAMLELGGIPLRASDRGEGAPLVVAGGPCVSNAEPIAPFFDAMFLGEGEEQMPMVCEVVRCAKKEGLPKKQILQKLSKIPGVYIPSFYTPKYSDDGKIVEIEACENAPMPVQKALLKNFTDVEPTVSFVVPMVGTVHDRAQIEVLRGCERGCRFCQAGFIYRPLRERKAEMLNEAARRLCQNTGYEEMSLTSLSTSDHSELEPLLDSLLSWTSEEKINLSLPSLRVDNFTKSLVDKVSRVRKSGLTFAPEAGTQRLRDVINKNVSEEEIERTCELAFEAGYSSVKLYFMMGLPTETMEDIEGIANTAKKIVELYYQNPRRRKGQAVKVSISVACFVPKAMTPFECVGQDDEKMLRQKQQHLLQCVHGNRKISVSYHDSRVSLLEAAFARGDRRLADILELAYQKGCCFDGWDELFQFELWKQAFEEQSSSMEKYANRSIAADEMRPWEHLDYGVNRAFLQNEYQKALCCDVTEPCRSKCAGCGVNNLLGRACYAND